MPTTAPTPAVTKPTVETAEMAFAPATFGFSSTGQTSPWHCALMSAACRSVTTPRPRPRRGRRRRPRERSRRARRERSCRARPMPGRGAATRLRTIDACAPSARDDRAGLAPAGVCHRHLVLARIELGRRSRRGGPVVDCHGDARRGHGAAEANLEGGDRGDHRLHLFPGGALRPDERLRRVGRHGLGDQLVEERARREQVARLHVRLGERENQRGRVVGLVGSLEGLDRARVVAGGIQLVGTVRELTRELRPAPCPEAQRARDARRRVP